jgi:methionyl-tRNA synthetase
MVSVVVEIQTYYETREYSKVVREVMTLADRANRYIDSAQPWTVAKQEGQEAKLQGICTMGLNLFKLLIGYLRPILPSIATNAEKFLNIQPVTFATLHEPLLNHTINQFQPLLTRIETSKIAAMMAESTI